MASQQNATLGKLEAEKNELKAEKNALNAEKNALKAEKNQLVTRLAKLEAQKAELVEKEKAITLVKTEEASQVNTDEQQSIRAQFNGEIVDLKLEISQVDQQINQVDQHISSIYSSDFELSKRIIQLEEHLYHLQTSEISPPERFDPKSPTQGRKTKEQPMSTDSILQMVLAQQKEFAAKLADIRIQHNSSKDIKARQGETTYADISQNYYQNHQLRLVTLSQVLTWFSRSAPDF